MGESFGFLFLRNLDKVVIEYSRTNGRGKSLKKEGVVEKLNEKIFSFWKISFLETLVIIIVIVL